jgi:hypothetical protein
MAQSIAWHGGIFYHVSKEIFNGWKMKMDGKMDEKLKQVKKEMKKKRMIKAC